MSADVERVRAAIAPWYVGDDLIARIMAETLLIAAEALRGPAIGFVDHLEVADWLTARAQETTDDIA